MIIYAQFTFKTEQAVDIEDCHVVHVYSPTDDDDVIVYIHHNELLRQRRYRPEYVKRSGFMAVVLETFTYFMDTFGPISDHDVIPPYVFVTKAGEDLLNFDFNTGEQR